MGKQNSPKRRKSPDRFITESDIARLEQQGYTLAEKRVNLDGSLELVVNDPVQCSTADRTWKEYQRVTLKSFSALHSFLETRA